MALGFGVNGIDGTEFLDLGPSSGLMKMRLDVPHSGTDGDRTPGGWWE